MLVAFFGDTHGNLDTMYDVAQNWEARTGFRLDLIVQVGDFGFWLDDTTVDAMTRRHGERLIEQQKARGEETRRVCGDFPEYMSGQKKVTTPTLVIRGNHEDQEFLMDLERSLEEEHPEDYLTRAIEVVPQLFYLPDGHVIDWDGVRFGALGGNFSYKTWKNWEYWDKAREKVTKYGEKRRLNHFTRDRAEALRREKVDVLLFHDAPTGMHLQGASGIQLPEDEMTEKIYNEFGCPHLKELMLDISPEYTFCGHWHQYRKERFGDTTCIVLDQTATTPSTGCMEVVEL